MKARAQPVGLVRCNSHVLNPMTTLHQLTALKMGRLEHSS